MQLAEPLEGRLGFQQPGVLFFGVVVVAAVVTGFLQGVSPRSHDVPDHVPVLADIAEDPHAGFDIDRVHDLINAFQDPIGEHELTHSFSPCTR